MAETPFHCAFHLEICIGDVRRGVSRRPDHSFWCAAPTAATNLPRFELCLKKFELQLKKFELNLEALPGVLV